jgi:hypothetical protein
MVKVHRSILDRLGPRPVPAVLLDTPFGFQENARELSLRAMAYFDESLQTKLSVASGLDPAGDEQPDPRFAEERLTTNIQNARYVFSGPGSPTYALRKWQGTVVPQLLAEKIALGGAVTFASAAALTLGAFTTPVYEIYKVGADPYWLEGLNITSAAGLNVAVVPHYNNAEGGTHDTRFCYLGDRRLTIMEELLPDDCFVLGIDEHTSCVLDLDARTATVGGLGLLTVRKNGRSSTFESGEVLPIDLLVDTAFRRPASFIDTSASERDLHEAPPVAAPISTSPLIDLVLQAEAGFDAAVASGDGPGATAVILQLEQEIHEWSTDIPGQDELARSRASLRSMTAKLGSIAIEGLRDPVQFLAPYVDLLVTLRSQARAGRRFDDADEIRNRLMDLGIEIHDTPNETTWEMAQRS